MPRNARSAGTKVADSPSIAVQVPKSSTSYILRALEAGGYVRREADSKYRLGLALLSLSSRAMESLDVRQIALPILQHLVERSGLTAHLAVVDHGQAVYIAKVDAPGFIKMNTWPGRRMNLHSTSVGKALLAWLSEEEVQGILGKGMKKWTAHTITTPAKLFADLEHIRRRGYAVDEQESTMGIRCVAAPVFGAQGVAASIGLTGTVTQFHASEIPRFAEMVKDAARRVSLQLGGSSFSAAHKTPAH